MNGIGYCFSMGVFVLLFVVNNLIIIVNVSVDSIEIIKSILILLCVWEIKFEIYNIFICFK